jgi:outer membrane protein assembly factor BamD
MKTILFLIIALNIFTGCADKTKTESKELFNKPAAFWYKSIIKAVRMGNLDKADEAYTSLSSEHVASPLLKEALLILAQAHKEHEEYIMANFYIDEYTKRFARSKNIEYLKYLKIESNFQSFKKINRDQKLLLDTITGANNYIQKYPSSPYSPLVNTMLTRLYLAEHILNKNIVKLYKKTGKKKAAKIYQDKVDASWLKNTDIIAPQGGIFSSIVD